ncbi:MAG: family 20 glycosylhydrolase, partial [Flavobacteriales bacterium]|nr:family 20 glycosylhydrolase [Flavobacteriales bacterium]
MRNIFLSLLFIFTLFSCTNNQNEEIVAVDYGIIPQPKSIVSHGSNFTLSEKVVIVVKESGKEMLFTAKYLKKRINSITGIELTISDKEDSTGKNIVLVNSSYNNSSSAYQLDITKNNILISGENAGVFYGVQSLLQIINKNKNNLPTCTIDDSSRFEWRGMHLDESRHFFGVGEVKKYIDLIAMYKLNVFHWHLTDDQGWRIEIKSHPKLTEVGAWREGTGKEIWSYDIKPATEGKPKYGGFYTQEQIKEVIEYASERFVTIIPEIELPGHSWSALSAYPELSCSGKLYEKPKDIYFQFTDPYCAGNEQTFDLLEDVLTEVFDLFPSEYVHIGGDEAKKTPWEECTKCQNRMHEESIKNVEELQSYFIKRIERFASSKGKKIIGWDEIMEGGLPKEAVVMSWTGTENGIKAATLGYNTIMIPQQFTYFDPNQDISIPSPGNVLVLKDVYDYNPAPDTLSENILKNIIGVQAAIWTETVYSNAILETVLLPRLTAISEVAWSENENKNWDNYLSRLENQLSFFDLLGVNYFIQSPYGLQDNIFTGDKVDVNLTSPYKSATIRYTINGDTPTIDSKIF